MPEQRPKKSGMIWMLICCLAPILLIAGLAATGWSGGSLLYVAALLICPIGMIAMMFTGRGSHCAPTHKHNRDSR